MSFLFTYPLVLCLLLPSLDNNICSHVCRAGRCLCDLEPTAGQFLARGLQRVDILPSLHEGVNTLGQGIIHIRGAGGTFIQQLRDEEGGRSAKPSLKAKGVS
jgi:hypothetical protein